MRPRFLTLLAAPAIVGGIILAVVSIPVLAIIFGAILAIGLIGIFFLLLGIIIALGIAWIIVSILVGAFHLVKKDPSPMMGKKNNSRLRLDDIKIPK